MALARSIATRSLRQLRAAKSTLRVQRPAQRGYASGHGQPKTSDMPWLITSIAVTVPGTFLLLNSGSLHNPFSYPLPGSKYHGHHEEGEEHEEDEHEAAEEETETKDEEKPEDEDPQNVGGMGDQTAEGDEGKQLPDDEPEAGAELSKKAADGGAAKSDEETELEDDSDSKVIHKPDAKGGAKRRIESGNAEKLGEEDDESSDPDEAAASKKEVGGFDKQSGKQAGLSNTDTKHSTDPAKNPDQSTKGEGSPETAKLQGTVDPARPQK